MKGFERRRIEAPQSGGRALAPDGSTAVVVGGGLGGIAAATILAERGVRVTVIERETFLGGRAGAWTEHLGDGTPFEMERGFHGFFRQYYNLRQLLRRVDPDLSFLTPLSDYPLLGPGGAVESFCHLPRIPVLNVAALVKRSEHLRVLDLPKVAPLPALAMLTFDPERTWERFDRMSAREYLDSLKFPEHARRMLFDVFSHSFFNPEERLSAAELLMNFHFYFMGNPEGLVFDVMNEPFSVAFWEPMQRYLEERGVRFLLGRSAERVERHGDGWRVVVDGAGSVEADGAVLAVTVPGLQQLVEASPDLDDASWRRSVDGLRVTWPFAVWRLWLDRPCRPERDAFVGTAGLGILDNISVYERFEGESRRWAERTGGSVVELHAYAVPPERGEADICQELLARLHELYPETRDANILEARFLLRRDCPSFEPGSHAGRPTSATPMSNLALAGDFVRTAYPSALMERATATGFEAAGHLLARWNVRGEPLQTVPPRGILSRLPI